MDQRELPEQLPDDLATLWFLVRRVAGLLDRQGDAVCRSELGISLAQFLVLSVIDAYPGRLSQQAVADRLGLTKGTVSRQIEAAAAAGLITVRVNPDTRRENAVALTRTGTALVRRGDAVMAESRAELLSAIRAKEIPATRRVLTAMAETLEA
jgi:DNA-binding MarR family transcriptional regulator